MNGDGGERLKEFLNHQANVRLAQLGYSRWMIRDAKREGWWWLKARGRALRTGAGLATGRAVAWTDLGRAELVQIDEPLPGPGEATVEVLASVVSPGTERAQLLGLPNARVKLPFRPGYSAAGRVLAVGAGVTQPRVGDHVALPGTHSSVVTVAASQAYPVPPGVPSVDAAFVQLGIIARQGVALARVRPGDGVCVLGAGAVGALALRLARAAGAERLTVVATSRRREAAARAGGATAFLLAGADAAAIAALDADVVIEATGDPDALVTAVGAARPGGRVVLLGSTRGTVALPVEPIREKRLRVVGGHVSTLVRGRGSQPGAFRREGIAFLDDLGQGRVAVADLVSELIDPREAAVFYQRLAGPNDLVTALFDWTCIPRDERVAKGRLLRPPDLSGAGVEYGRKPLAPGGERPVRLLRRSSAFDGARGGLRFGLLGCGDIGVENADAISAAPNARLVACFDPAAALAEEVARAHGAQAEASIDALLGRADVDAVFLAVPHHLHAPLAEQAAAAGKHVLVEKPPANDLQSAVRMTQAAERAGVTLSVCFPHRYQPGALAARALVDEGALGRFGGALLTFLTDKPPSYWHGGFSGRAFSDWRASRDKAGGGVLIMNLSHYLDLVRHLVGVEVEEVLAVAGPVDRPAEVEDTISLSLRFANGAIGSVLGSAAVRGTWEGKTSTELRLWGSEGHVAVEGREEVFTLRAVAGLKPGRWQTFGELPSLPMRAVLVSRFATAIADSRPPDVTVADALAVQALIEAAYRSSETGRAVRPASLLAEAGR